MNSLESLDWSIGRFDQLSAREVYLIAKLRVDVFVVEQNCAYAELDGQDLMDDTVHIVGKLQGLPLAYARILAPECLRYRDDKQSSPAVHIGRVVVERRYRRHGLATLMMHRVLDHCEKHFAGHDQALAAQVSAIDFYVGLGFTACSEHYLEDGIAHVDMVRTTL
ncbi:MAG: GNAT family N-acetyltransferase [Granulosicoccus sp.]